jgi:uncharacterized membrane protein
VEQSSERFPALEAVILIAEREWVVRDFTSKQEMIAPRKKALGYGITLVIPMYWCLPIGIILRFGMTLVESMTLSCNITIGIGNLLCG